MSFQIPQSTAVTVVFKAYLSSDHVSEATGKTIAITISKAGGAFGNPNAGATNATEISSGWYKVALDTTDTGTLGHLAVRGAVATIDDVGIVYQVVKATNAGLTALPDTAVTTNASLVTSGTGSDQIVVASGKVDAGKINGVSAASVTTINANLGSTQPINFTGTSSSALVKGDAIDINSVAASSVTTINANIGMTQPINFTGTGASALVKSDAVDIAGSAVSTSSAQIGVNVVNFGGSAGTFASGIPAASLTSAERNSTADALLDRADAIETGFTVRGILRIIGAACGGKASGLATTTAVYRDVTDTKDRITATVDSSGNRTAVTLVSS